jgi:hypothetical protein
VRHGRYKLLRDSLGAVELYDVVDDPGETVDLSEQLPDVVADLGRRLERWRAERAAVSPAAERADEPSAEEKKQLEALGYL